MYRFWYAQIVLGLRQYDVEGEYNIAYKVGNSVVDYRIKVTLVTGTHVWADIIEEED